jgi:predicted transcriptional regulator
MKKDNEQFHDLTEKFYKLDVEVKVLCSKHDDLIKSLEKLASKIEQHIEQHSNVKNLSDYIAKGYEIFKIILTISFVFSFIGFLMFELKDYILKHFSFLN